MSGGSNAGHVAAVMFNPDLEPILNYGQSARLGLPRPVDDATTCARCVLPAGDYDLFVFGPFRRNPDDPALRVALRLEGLPDGTTALPDAAGNGAYIISASSAHGRSSDTYGGNGIHTAVFPLFYDGARRDGVYISQATVAGAETDGGLGEVSLTAQVNNRPELAPDVGMPFQHLYTANAAPSQGAALYEVRGAVPSTVDRKFPYLYAHGDTAVVNHPAWAKDLALLWLTTSTEEPGTTAEPPLDISSQRFRATNY